MNWCAQSYLPIVMWMKLFWTKRLRTVKWLVQGKNIGITEFRLEKSLTLSTVYRLNTTVATVIDVLNKNGFSGVLYPNCEAMAGQESPLCYSSPRGSLVRVQTLRLDSPIAMAEAVKQLLDL